jgi:transposase
VCVMRDDGEIVGNRKVAHTTAAVHEALRWIAEVTKAPPHEIPVGIETPRGVLVDTLIEQGFQVFAINPKQLDRFRDRFSAAGAKDDPRDARVLADALRTDSRAFRRVRSDDPQIIYLRELSRIAEEQQETTIRLTNRLRDQLYRIDAAWLELSPAADDAWLWDLLSPAPQADQWARLSRTRIARVLKEHRIRRVTADDVVTVLRTPRLAAAPGVAEAVATRIAMLVPQLLLIHQQRKQTERAIEQSLARLAEPSDTEPREHRDVVILRSLPGVGRIVAATMLTEAAGPLAERDYATLRAHGGIAPVTKRSSKRTFAIHMRYACKHRLRRALYHWSRTSIQHDEAARTYYDRLRARGHQHNRALRSVADRWLRILVSMLQAGTVYDPSRFQHRVENPA